MITNFENITTELTKEEMEILPVLVDGFKGKTKENPVKAPAIVKGLNSFFKSRMVGIKMTEARLRKMTNYIRSNAILPLIATSNGYYVSYDETEIADQIRSMEERANSIRNAANGLRKIMTQSN